MTGLSRRRQTAAFPARPLKDTHPQNPASLETLTDVPAASIHHHFLLLIIRLAALWSQHVALQAGFFHVFTKKRREMSRYKTLKKSTLAMYSTGRPFQCRSICTQSS